MKHVTLLLILIAVGMNLCASVRVEYTSQRTAEAIKTVDLNGVDYFNVYELNKVFNAIIRVDVLDSRVNIGLYNQQLIALLESSYVQYHASVYNITHPVVQNKGKVLLPVTFLTELLPAVMPERVVYRSGSLVADPPVDNSIRRIVLDPGHGGKDPGAIGYSKRNFEKDIALTVAKKVKALLEKELDVEVLLTRSNDSFVSLQSRTDFANEHEADLFISMHCNAHRNSKVKGIEVFYLSTAKTDEARAVESLENSVVYDYEGGTEAVQKYDDLALILADMAQSEHLEESYQMAMKLQANLVDATKGRDRGVKQANFYVLRGAFMPAVLVEMGFLTNPDEEKELISGNHQKKLARSIADEIENFKAKYDQMQ
jgi:N-acetylmuramoyl-L-alanine amidase